MKIVFKVSYPTNLYYFVENLACWHKFSKVKYKDKFYPKLNASQKKLLASYTRVRKKYADDRGFDAAWTKANWKQSLLAIKKKTSKKDFQIISETYNSLEKVFGKIWKSKAEKDLENMKRSLEKEKKKLAKAIKKLQKIFSSKLKPPDIYLCWNPIEFGGSGGFGHGITVEGSPRNSVADLFRIILHETTHFLDLHTINMIKKFEKSGMSKSKAFFMREAVTDMFAVEFTKEFLGKKPHSNWGKAEAVKNELRKIWMKNTEKDFWDEILPEFVKIWKLKKYYILFP